MEPEKNSGSLEPSDCDLMMRVKAGDQEAFAVLIGRHQGPLLNFFRRLGVYNDTEDLVQETLVRVFKYRRRYSPLAKFTTFLYTVARHAWVDWLRKLKRNEAFVERYTADTEKSNDGTMGRKHSMMDAQIALERLSENLRVVVVMSLYQGMKYEEIADSLDVPVGTVKSRMFTALGRLKEMMSGNEKGWK